MSRTLHSTPDPAPAPTGLGGPLAAAVGRAWRWVAAYGWGVAALLLIVAVTGRMVLGPVHAVRDAAACRRAYAHARTHQDTVSVDLTSYPDSAAPRGRGSCGLTRTATLGSLGW